MTPRTRRALGAAVAVAVVALAIWQGWPAISRQGEHATPRAGTDSTQSVDTGPEASPGTSRDDTGLAPLPPDDAPLAGILAPLAARADAGDRKAACRLAMELLRCEHLVDNAAFQMRPSDPPKRDDAGAKQQDAAVKDYMARDRAWTRERLAQCEAVPDHLLEAGARYLEQAALAGEPEAMVRYAEGHHWQPTGRGMMVGPDFDRWRRNAPGMMQRALESGYPGAAFLLMIAYRDDFGFHSALIPNDAEQSMVMNMLYARLYGSQGMAGFYRHMDAASQARATELAQALHERYFQGRRFHGYPYPTPGHLMPDESTPFPGFCREP